jgi:hypothetical protein
VVKEQLKSSHNLLLAAADERHDLIGTEKPMPVNDPDNLPVTFTQPQGSSDENAFETGKSFLHRAILAYAKLTA